MFNEDITGLINHLPTDWWQKKSVGEILSGWFNRYLVGLYLSVETEGKVQHRLYTGFLLYHKENLMWATAGHVIDAIEKIRSDSRAKILRMRWADRYRISGAESIPVHNYGFKTFSASEFGIDFGVADISGLDRENILKNDQLEIMTQQGWKNLHLAKPEGYYILGYPQEWIEVEEKHISDNRILGSLWTNIACLPVQQIEYPGRHSGKKFWDDPEAFYGRILPFSDEAGNQPIDIIGMSGGPLLSIERDKSKQIRYRLFGIQRSWDKDTRSIRVEPIQNIINVIGK